MVTSLKNWAGNYEYSTVNIHYPETVDQVQTLVKQHKMFRVLGTRHSFNGIADSAYDLISLAHFKPAVIISHEKNSVSLAACLNYAELCPTLQDEGFALHNLASLPHISVIGACTTATHGSGDHNQNLAAAVSALEIVTASGDLVRLARGDESFDRAVVGLGGLGVVVNLTLDLLPTFEMRQVVYEKLPVAQMEAHFDEIMSSAYSVSLLTDWQTDYIDQIWLKQRDQDYISVEQRPNLFGATPATKQKHPIANFPADQCTPQLGILGPWHERLPHFRSDGTPSAGNELQSEYFVARKDAIAAIRAIAGLRNELAQPLLLSEIRSIAADNFWMSPCYHQDSIAIHFTWKPDWQSVRKVLPMIEAKLEPFEVRPHWGKLFTMPPKRLQSLYEKLPQFQELLKQFDPQGKFRNAFLDTTLFGD